MNLGIWKTLFGLAFVIFLLPSVGLAQSDGTLDRYRNLEFEELYSGDRVSLAEDYNGKPLIINSWASWCPFCVEELPDFNRLVETEGGDGNTWLSILAINRGESRAKIESFIKVDLRSRDPDSLVPFRNIKFLLDEKDSFYEPIGGFTMPETLFVNAEGEIVLHKRGFMSIAEMRGSLSLIQPAGSTAGTDIGGLVEDKKAGGIGFSFIAAVFIAGILTFLAPCTLPLVPGYIGFISGVPESELKSPDLVIKKNANRKIFYNGLFFVLGFSIIFILFGTLTGLLGAALVGVRLWLTRIAGVLVILFGLFMLGVFKLRFLQGEKRMRIPKFLNVGRPSSSLLIGGAFAIGWTPCVGPILGGVLALSLSSATALSGAMLLAVFSLGLGLPFLLVALGFSRAAHYIGEISRYLKWVSIIGGLLLIGLGILLVLGDFELTIEYGYRLLDGIGYSNLMNHL